MPRTQNPSLPNHQNTLNSPISCSHICSSSAQHQRPQRRGNKSQSRGKRVGGGALAESGQTKRYVLIPPVLTSKTAGSSAQLALHSTAPDWGLYILARDIQAVITAFQLLFSHQTLRHCGDRNGCPRRGAKSLPKTEQDRSTIHALCEDHIIH